MKVDFGACRTIGVRTAQIEAYTMIGLNWLGVPPGFWSISILAVIAVAWPVFDYLKVWPQEQAFGFRHNAEFQRLRGAVESHYKKAQDEP